MTFFFFINGALFIPWTPTAGQVAAFQQFWTRNAN